LVTGAFKVDPADPKKAIPDNKLSVIDLKAKPPAVIATLDAGLGAAGVSINNAGTLALVANRSEGNVSVFTVAGNNQTPAGRIQDSTWRFKIWPESCRLHARWQERSGNSRWRQPGFDSHHRRQQG